MNLQQTDERLSEASDKTRNLQRVAVVENPASGQTSPRRKAIIRETLAALHQAGVDTEHLMIDGPGSGSALTRQAVARGCDAVIEHTVVQRGGKSAGSSHAPETCARDPRFAQHR